MDNKCAVEHFKNILNDQPDVSPAIAALTVLLDFLNKDTSETIQGLDSNIKSLVEDLNKVDGSVTSVKSASELFMRFITLTSLDHSDFNECKQVLQQRGVVFLNRVNSARSKIAKNGSAFIRDRMKILVHSYSRVVFQTLLYAHSARKHFSVYVTESAPDYSGRLMHEKLEKAGIESTLILDASIGYVLESMDMVFLGAEGVVKNGGILNKIGSFPIAMCAKVLKKPVNVLAESFKFNELFPLNNRDLPHELQLFTLNAESKKHPLLDYTPPSFINLLFSDLGILTPDAVSEELIKLYM